MLQTRLTILLQSEFNELDKYCHQRNNRGYKVMFLLELS